MATTPRKRTAKTAAADAPTAAAPPPDEVEQPPDVPQFQFSAETARTLREAPHVVKFLLPYTAPGAFAWVKPMDFNDPSMLRMLPRDLQIMAIQMAETVERGGDPRNPVLDDDGRIIPEKALEYADLEKELARTIALKQFHKPRLVVTPDEVGDDDDVVWIEDIHPADLRQFLFFTLRPHQEAAAQLATFPG